MLYTTFYHIYRHLCILYSLVMREKQNVSSTWWLSLTSLYRWVLVPPHNKCPSFQRVWPTERHVGITYYFLSELEKESHTCMDGFTTHDLLPCIFINSTCHKDKTAGWRKEQTSLLTAHSKATGPCKVATLAATSTASLLGRPAWSGTQQNTTDFHDLWRQDTWKESQ
jgi:hypothetical protein